MGVEPPLVYDHPSKYSFVGPTQRQFNPKAASQASWSQPTIRPRIEGPLIKSREFNRHPDSYFVVPYGNLNYKSMSPRTKSKVKWTRHTQLLLRTCELVAAVGMLFCVICIKGTDDTTGWIIRVPPGIAILHTVYAIYHLARSSKGRTPSSSASYMLFAAFVDAGLIPFLVFTALIARTEYVEPVNADHHWSTLFDADGATVKITHATFLVSVVSGSLHLISLVISIYLGVIFRQISRLPPDMNPLEDNLTSRHKHKNSSLSNNTMSETTNSPAKKTLDSQVHDPLIGTPRAVPFMHTRTDSYENKTQASYLDSFAGKSQNDLSKTPFYDQPPAHRSSQTNIRGPFYTQAAPKYSSYTEMYSTARDETSPDRSSRNKSHSKTSSSFSHMKAPSVENARPPTEASSIYSDNTTATIAADPPASIKARCRSPSFDDSNWITHPSPAPSRSPSPLKELRHLRSKQSFYQPISQDSSIDLTPETENLFPKPLEMNPPTPPMHQQEQRRAIEQRALTSATGNVGQRGWGLGPGSVGIGKARAWGDRTGGAGPLGGGGRVVSRSGIELPQEGSVPNGRVRGREVSGKVMEEGRGGKGGWTT